MLPLFLSNLVEILEKLFAAVGLTGPLPTAISILLLGIAAIYSFRVRRRKDALDRELAANSKKLVDLTEETRQAKDLADQRLAELTAKEQSLSEKNEKIDAQSAQVVEMAARFNRQAAELEAKTNALNAKQAEIAELRASLHQPQDELWARRNEEALAMNLVAQANADLSAFIIAVANQKGGVGKSTTTANLAAAFAHANQRVLIIDFDYQGSLTQQLLSALPEAQQQSHRELINEGARADRLLLSDTNVDRLHSCTIDIVEALHPDANANARLDLVAADYRMANMDTSMFASYLFREDKDDQRFRLARVLGEREVQGLYDVILIDLPPRLVSGAVNALIACTHLLVPTIADEMSAPASVRYLGQARKFRELNPNLKLLALLPSMTYRFEKLTDRESKSMATIERQISSLWTPPVSKHGEFPFVSDVIIPENALFSKALIANKLAYNFDEGGKFAARTWYDALRDELQRRR